MQTEIEAKWVNVDFEVIRQKLRELGATLVQPERLMTRQVFDYPDKRLQKVGAWVRVRNEGEKITLSYKRLESRTAHGMKEATVAIDDFDAACTILESIGLESYAYQETKRESWKLGRVEIELDIWPWIPGFVEIEAASEDELKKAAEQLGLDYADALHGSVEIAYQAVYDVTEEEIDSWEEIKFIDVPDWLAVKRKDKS